MPNQKKLNQAKWKLQFGIMIKEGFTLKEKFHMAYYLLVCGYYDFKAKKTKYIYLQRGYDSMYLANWIMYKQIYYKPRKK